MTVLPPKAEVDPRCCYVGQKLNALVADLFIGNKECPTRRAGSMSAQSWEARTCVVRWNGTKFTYKPL